ncbi:MAG: hypothetical protein ACI9OJ_004745 [Myxococcota bacterium]
MASSAPVGAIGPSFQACLKSPVPGGQGVTDPFAPIAPPSESQQAQMGSPCDSDKDGDGVCQDVDNCPDAKNDDQIDGDTDGLGDACDACPADGENDPDSDGICQDLDNCVTKPNPTQVDSDADGIGDDCDSCPADSKNDADQDGFCADVDNCPDAANPIAPSPHCVVTSHRVGDGRVSTVNSYDSNPDTNEVDARNGLGYNGHGAIAGYPGSAMLVVVREEQRGRIDPITGDYTAFESGFGILPPSANGGTDPGNAEANLNAMARRVGLELPDHDALFANPTLVFEGDYGVALVQVADGAGNPVAGQRVMGHFRGLGESIQSAVTDAFAESLYVDSVDVVDTCVIRNLSSGTVSSALVFAMTPEFFMSSGLSSQTVLFRTSGTGLASSAIVWDWTLMNPDLYRGDTLGTWSPEQSVDGFGSRVALAQFGRSAADEAGFQWDDLSSSYPANGAGQQRAHRVVQALHADARLHAGIQPDPHARRYQRGIRAARSAVETARTGLLQGERREDVVGSHCVTSRAGRRIVAVGEHVRAHNLVPVPTRAAGCRLGFHHHRVAIQIVA